MTWLERQGCLCPHTSCVTYGLTFSYRFGNAARHLSQRTTPIWLKAFWTLARIWTSKSLIELLWPSSLALVLRYALVYQSCIVAMLTNGLVLVHFPLLATTRTATVDPVPRSWRGVDSSRQHSRTFQRIANKGGCKRYTFTTHNTRPCNPWTRHLQQHDSMPFFPTMPTNTTRILFSSLLHFRFLRNSYRPDGTLLSLKAEMVIRVVLDTMIYWQACFFLLSYPLFYCQCDCQGVIWWSYFGQGKDLYQQT